METKLIQKEKINSIDNEYEIWERKIRMAENSFLYNAPKKCSDMICEAVKSIDKNLTQWK